MIKQILYILLIATLSFQNPQYCYALRPKASSFSNVDIAGFKDIDAKPPKFVDISRFDMHKFRDVVGEKQISYIEKEVNEFKQRLKTTSSSVWHINSIQGAGGVSDILNGISSLSISLGLDSRWFVISGNNDFFTTTTKWHNILHGVTDITVTDKELENYCRISDFNVHHLLQIKRQQRLEDPAFIIIHDQQPLGMITRMKKAFPDTRFIWRGHIPYIISDDPDSSSNKTWQFLNNLVNQCDGAVFHIPEYTTPGLNIPAHYIMPSINAVGLINRNYSNEFIAATFTKYNIESNSRPLVIQNSRFDRLKDQKGVIEAYEKTVIRMISEKRLLLEIPILGIIGPSASDNKEGLVVYSEVKDAAEKSNMRIDKLLRDAYGTDKSLQQNINIRSFDPNAVRLNKEQIAGLNELQGDILRSRQEAGIDGYQSLDAKDIDINSELPPHQLHEIEIAAFQDAASVIFIKSLKEGFGLALTGAKFHSKPCIASSVGGLEKQIIDARKNPEGTGFLVGFDDKKGVFDREKSVEESAEVLYTLMTDKLLRDRVGDNARKDIKGNFLLDRHLHDYISMFTFLNSIINKIASDSANKANQIPAISVIRENITHTITDNILSAA